MRCISSIGRAASDMSSHPRDGDSSSCIRCLKKSHIESLFTCSDYKVTNFNLLFTLYFVNLPKNKRKIYKTMIKTILSIAGKPGLYRLVSQGRNMLIVESIATGKRMPAFARDKVMSLGDIAMYTTGDDIPLADVLELVKVKTDCKPVDVKTFAGDVEMRAFFGEVLPEFDRDRVHDSDIRKLFQWYNLLLDAGITDFKEEMQSAQKPVEEADEAEAPASAE